MGGRSNAIGADSPPVFYWGPEAATYFLFDNIHDELALRIPPTNEQRRDGPSTLLNLVGLSDLAQTAKITSPHALSGGQQQRLLAALILANLPPFILAQTPLIYAEARARPLIYSAISQALIERGATMLVVGEEPDALRHLEPQLLTATAFHTAAPNSFPQSEGLPLYNPPLRRGAGGAIELHDLAWTYPDGRSGVHVQDLAFPKGQVSVICGPNGGGKSSIIRSLVSDWKPKPPASVRLDGTRIRCPFKELVRRQHLAFALQDPNLHAQALTVATMLRSSQVPPQMASSLRLSDYAEEQVLLAPFWVKQALSFAVAMSSDAAYIALDEPIDGFAMRIVGPHAVGILSAARDNGKGILLVTHSPSFAHSVGDRFIWVENRRVLACHTRATIDSAPAQLRDWLSQGKATCSHA